ncbi:MAG: hypothetical protein ABI369_15370 [Acetobacteraceae bacterium]
MVADGASKVACTLGPTEFQHRLARIRDLTRRSLRDRERDGLRLILEYDVSAADEVRELVGMERECCGFLDFELDEQADRLLLTITAPPAAHDSIEEVFSEFAG